MEYKDMNAIGIVRLMLTDGVITEEQAAKYFPELAESEDERIRKIMIEHLKNKPEQYTFGGLTNAEVVAWLEKKGEQKPWSEEDEDNLTDIFVAIDNFHSINRKKELITFLKSLIPQSQWKPSDEQMDALDGICSYIRNKADWEISQDMVSDLYKLSEQLKKLREE